MVRLALALSLLALTTGCVDDETLENTECFSGADCAPSQSCLKTPYQESRTITTPTGMKTIGWCRPEGDGCAVGAQPGCFCENVNGVNTCSGVVVPLEENSVCYCVYDESGTAT